MTDHSNTVPPSPPADDGGSNRVRLSLPISVLLILALGVAIIPKLLLAAVVTEEFLRFSAQVGNDLVTPRPEFGFPGLRPGDRWCLCAGRWAQAHEAGVAPPVGLAASHARSLEWIDLADLQRAATT